MQSFKVHPPRGYGGALVRDYDSLKFPVRRKTPLLLQGGHSRRASMSNDVLADFLFRARIDLCGFEH